MPVGTRIRANNVYGLVTDNPLTIGATTMNSASLGLLPVVVGNHAVLVLDPKRVFGEPELIVVTSHLALSSSAAIIRGQYGTTARAHPMNTPWAHVAINEDYISVVTSSTHPSNPYEGQFIYETDTNSALVYNGGGWVPFGGGGGTSIAQQTFAPTAVIDALWLDTDESAGTGLSSIIGYAEVTANQGSIAGTNVDLTGLSVTITVPAGRRIRISSRTYWTSTTGDGDVFSAIFEGATQLQENREQLASSSIPTVTDPGVIISPTAGTHTYKLVARRIVGTGTLTSNANANFPAYLLVEDITGTLWPAGASIGAGQIANEAWTSFVPSLDQGVTTNIAKTINYSRYYRTGRMITFQFHLTVSGTGTASSTISVSLPFAGVSYGGAGDRLIVGTGQIFDSSANNFYQGLAGFGNGTGATTIIFYPTDIVAGIGTQFIGLSAMTAALAANDLVTGSITYEAAS